MHWPGFQKPFLSQGRTQNRFYYTIESTQYDQYVKRNQSYLRKTEIAASYQLANRGVEFEKNFTSELLTFCNSCVYG
jgi:hypothetical protein